MSAQKRIAGRKYVEIPPEEKLKLLNDHSMRDGWDSLDKTKWCLHCEKEFTGSSARIYKEHGMLLVECGTPDCDGSPLDFMDFPMWDRDHPVTKAHDKAMREAMEADKSRKKPTN